MSAASPGMIVLGIEEGCGFYGIIRDFEFEVRNEYFETAILRQVSLFERTSKVQARYKY